MWSSIIRPLTLSFLLLTILNVPVNSHARDLPQILEAGVLRHLGIPYANFITGSGDGLDAELMQGFANYIGFAISSLRAAGRKFLVISPVAMHAGESMVLSYWRRLPLKGM